MKTREVTDEDGEFNLVTVRCWFDDVVEQHITLIDEEDASV